MAKALNIVMHFKFRFFQGFLLVGLVVVNCFLIQAELYAESLSSAIKVKPIKIEITTHMGNDQTFFEGDHLSFYLNLDSDAYLLVIYRDASGNFIQLLPNRETANAFYQAGNYIRMPEKKATFQFKVERPFGKETLWVFASNVPPPDLSGTKLVNGLKILNVGLDALRNKLRKRQQAAYGEAQLVINTQARENID